MMRSCSSSALVEKILGFSRYGHLLEKLDMIESFLHFGVFRFPLNLGTLIGEIQEAQNYDEWLLFLHWWKMVIGFLVEKAEVDLEVVPRNFFYGIQTYTNPLLTSIRLV